MENYFDAHHIGPGIWKWRHYLEIYHRHLAKFRGRAINCVEVGVFSGGSLRMWEWYFGPQAHIHGVDLDEGTRAYQNAHVTIHIGDQEDRTFWARFRNAVPSLDILLDDGGHTPQQQQITLEEILPHLRAGGVYICEDIHNEGNAFTAYVSGLIDQLHAATSGAPIQTNSFQASVFSVHVYPFVVVIEKRDRPLPSLTAERHGSEWQPPVVVRQGYGKIMGRGG
ncbi:MAG: class I SAM-dependent methyltransferase [Planctomycetia bacterium]